MSCRDIQAVLHDYIGEALPEAQRRRVETHLNVCADCRQELSDIKATIALSRNLDTIEPPPFLASRIMAEIRSTAPKQSWLNRFFFVSVRIPVGVLAAIVVLFVSLHVYTVWMPGKPAGPIPQARDKTAHPLPENLSGANHSQGPDKMLTHHPLPDTTVQRLPDLRIVMRVRAIDPVAKQVLLRLIEMDSRILGIVANAGAYRIVADIKTEDKQEWIQFLERIDQNAEITGGSRSQGSTLVSIALIERP